MTSLPTPTTPADGDADSQSEYPTVKSPTRLYYILSQGLKFFLFSAVTLCIVLLSLIYLVLITLTVLPYDVASRKWDTLAACYSAPTYLLSNIYNAYRDRSRELASEWDVEKAKPLPLARLRRGFLSQELIASPQSGSDLMTRVPAEVRLQIYKEVIVGNRTRAHIIVHRTKTPGERRPKSKMHGQFFCHCYNIAAYAPDLPHCRAPCPAGAGRGILALSKTCKQVYLETKDLLYNLPTFYFDSILQPPFFLQSLLPQRLAQIKHIQLCYHSSLIRKYCTSTTQHTRRLRRQHNFQQCNTCNLNIWLDTIRKTMPGLKTVQLSIYLKHGTYVPSARDAWVLRLFQLQRGPNGLRDLQIRLSFEDLRNRMLPTAGGGHILGMSAFSFAPTWYLDIERTDQKFQEMIKDGAFEP